MTTDLKVAIVGAIGLCVAGVITLVGKYLPQRIPRQTEVAALRKEVKDLSDALDETRNTNAAAMAAMRESHDAAIAALRADSTTQMHVLTDYVHDLREDFARETGKAPKDWPEGLRL